MVEIADLGDVVEIVVGREYSRAVHNRIPRDQDVERTGRTGAQVTKISDGVRSMCRSRAAIR